jgi:hypothetical protein
MAKLAERNRVGKGINNGFVNPNAINETNNITDSENEPKYY